MKKQKNNQQQLSSNEFQHLMSVKNGWVADVLFGIGMCISFISFISLIIQN